MPNIFTCAVQRARGNDGCYLVVWERFIVDKWKKVLGKTYTTIRAKHALLDAENHFVAYIKNARDNCTYNSSKQKG